MTNSKLGAHYLRQALIRREFIRLALERAHHGVAMRLCQEAVELCLKAVLRFVGMEPPKWHDVGEILEKEKDRFPESFQQEIPFMKALSFELRQSRELSFYGDAESDAPASELFSENDARTAWEKTERVLLLCETMMTTKQK